MLSWGQDRDTGWGRIRAYIALRFALRRHGAPRGMKLLSVLGWGVGDRLRAYIALRLQARSLRHARSVRRGVGASYVEAAGAVAVMSVLT